MELTGPLKFKTDIGDLKESYKIPFIELNEKAGLGVKIDEEVLSQLTTDSCIIK